MKNKPTVTIGIPAFNEEGNIGLLLTDLFKQRHDGFVLEKIIVNSDGSTDKTVEIARKSRNPRLEVLGNLNNKGVAFRQNEILNKCTSDIFVILNADIRITDRLFLKRLIKPILDNEADLSSPKLTEYNARTFVESVLVIGSKLRYKLFTSWRNGQNGFLCHGAARAFSRKFYSVLRFKEGAGEDMYSYLKCIASGFVFKFVSNTTAYYRHPNNLRDHFKQSVRFFKYQTKVSTEFDRKLIAQELKIPFTVYLKGAFRALPTIIHNIPQVFCYVFIVMTMKINSFSNLDTAKLWNASSTKSYGK